MDFSGGNILLAAVGAKDKWTEPWPRHSPGSARAYLSVYHHPGPSA